MSDTASGVLKLLCWQLQKFHVEMLGQPCQASDDHRTVKQEVSTPRLKNVPPLVCYNSDIREQIFGRPFVKRFASCYCLSVCPVCPVTLVYCGQTVGRIKMKLGLQIGLNPGHIALDGDPAPPPPKGHSPQPIFGPYLLRPNGCIDQDATWYGGMPRPRRLCIRWGPSPNPKRAQSPLPNFGPISIVAKRLDASRCHLVQR